jgi:hypothetical protein
MKRKPVWITWRDAAHIGAGEWSDELPKDCGITCQTVGILVRRNKDHVVIAHTTDEAGLMTGVFQIPRSAIVRMVDLSD